MSIPALVCGNIDVVILPDWASRVPLITFLQITIASRGSRFPRESRKRPELKRPYLAV